MRCHAGACQTVTGGFIWLEPLAIASSNHVKLAETNRAASLYRLQLSPCSCTTQLLCVAAVQVIRSLLLDVDECLKAMHSRCGLPSPK